MRTTLCVVLHQVLQDTRPHLVKVDRDPGVSLTSFLCLAWLLCGSVSTFFFSLFHFHRRWRHFLLFDRMTTTHLLARAAAAGCTKDTCPASASICMILCSPKANAKPVLTVSLRRICAFLRSHGRFHRHLRLIDHCVLPPIFRLAEMAPLQSPHGFWMFDGIGRYALVRLHTMQDLPVC